MKSDLPHLSIRVKTYAFDRFTSFAILWNALLSLQLVAAEYSIRTWTVENGLPQNRVTCIAQTPEGYLWLGTEVGLTRFDGVQFELQRPEITPGLPLGGIVDLFVDGSGRLWVSGDNGFLGYLAEGTFSTIERDPHHAPTIRAMALDAADNLHLWDAHGQAYLWSEAKPFKQSSIPVPWFAKN